MPRLFEQNDRSVFVSAMQEERVLVVSAEWGGQAVFGL